jgi:hypothetical protein
MKTDSFAVLDQTNQANIYPINGLMYAPIQCPPASGVSDNAETNRSGLKVGDFVFGMKISYIAAIGIVRDVIPAGVYYEAQEFIGIEWWQVGNIAISPIFESEIQAAFNAAKSDGAYSGLFNIPSLLGESMKLMAPMWFTHHQGFCSLNAYDHTAHTHRTLAILARDDIADAKKLALLDALNGVGEFGKAVRARQPACPFLQEETPDSRVVHIRPWDDCTDDQRLDPENGVLLGTEYAQYFTTGFISFMESGQYYFTGALDFDVLNGCRGGPDNFALRNISPAQEAYLQYHRTYVVENWLIQGNMVLMDIPAEMLAAEKEWIPHRSGEGYVFKARRKNIADLLMESIAA